MVNNLFYACVFLSVFFATTGDGLTQNAAIRPSVLTTFGNQVSSALAQYVLRGDVRLASDVFITEERADNGIYELEIRTLSRLVAVIPHSVGRRSRGVSVAQATNAIVEQLVRRRLAVLRG